ncbi:MAG: hypothetical protein HYZ77_05985 [Serratia liquefaciens]|nr:hypothetical protein [Serratia liquefaciens]
MVNIYTDASTLSTEAATPATAEVASLEAPLHVDFNDGSMGGWQLDSLLDPTRVQQDGQLHFSANSLAEGQPLLWQSFMLTENQSYQIEFYLQQSDQALPPAMEVRVNGETVTLEIVKQGEGHNIKGSFTSLTSGEARIELGLPSELSVIPDIWLDNLVIQPAVEASFGTMPVVDELQDIHLQFLTPEPELTFSQLVLAPTEENSINIQLDSLLSSDYTPVFIESPAHAEELV